MDKTPLNRNSNKSAASATRKSDNSGYRIVNVPEAMRHRIQEWGREGSYIGHSLEESPWVPFGENAAIRHLAFDVRNNVYCNILWIKAPGMIGTHKHRGMVWAVGMEGSFKYLEYDWVCGPGDFITELPGAAHTLVTDHPEGMKALFWMQGANEFFDADGNHLETLDVFWFINHYQSYCEENNLPINSKLWI